MAYTPSKREQVLAAVFDLVTAACPGAYVERNRDKARSPSVGGDIVVRDGEPGEPTWDLSPPMANYSHYIPLEVQGFASETLTPEQTVDSLLRDIGLAVAADRTLGGLCDYLDLVAPDGAWTNAEGATALRNADAAIIAQYATPNPLT